MCSTNIIEVYYCLCAVERLLTYFLACVQAYTYLTPLLLVCSTLIIEIADCLCAVASILRSSIADVQVRDY